MVEKQGLAPWTARVLTLFPEMFPGPLAYSLAGKGLKDGIWALETVDIRDFARDKHRTVDDAPFGGGPGMVLRPDVVGAAIDSLAEKTGGQCGGPVIYLSPRGSLLTQDRVKALAAEKEGVLLCGRFEGVDERVLIEHQVEEISLGDYVLSGGEPAAIALIDACVRLQPGILGSAETLEEESFERGLLEYPHYTRPKVWQDHAAPEVLLSGNHKEIRDWRLKQAEAATKERRDDLWQTYLHRTRLSKRD